MEAKTLPRSRAYSALSRLFASTTARDEALAWSVVAVGVVLRVARYAHDRSLWGDEARLALNIKDRSVTGLFHPLDYVQAAPTGFLVAEKAVVGLFGDSEYALRLVPLLAGIGSLVLFVPLARRLLPARAALVAIVLYAVVEPLIYYSSEVKQYSVDAFATVALLLIAVPALEKRELSPRRALALLVAATAAVWFSHPSAFVVAGIWGALVVARVRTPGRQFVVPAVLGAVWLVSFGIAYSLVLRNAHRVSQALGLGAESTPGVGGVLRDGWHAFAYPAGFAYTTTALAATFTCVGAFVLARRNWRTFAPLALTILVAMLGASAGRYPFYDRFLLFAVPIVLLAVAAGLEPLARSPSGAVRATWLVALVLLAAYPIGEAAAHLKSPPPHEEIKPVLARIADAWNGSDALYVSTVAQFPLRYYAECNDCGVLDRPSRAGFRSFVLARRGGPQALRSSLPRLEVGHVDWGTPASTYISDFELLRGRPRVWFLFSSTWDNAEATRVLGCLGHQLEAVTSTRAVAYLYDLSAPPDLGRGQCLGG